MNRFFVRALAPLSLLLLLSASPWLQGCPNELCNDSKPCPSGQRCSADKQCVPDNDGSVEGDIEKNPSETNSETNSDGSEINTEKDIDGPQPEPTPENINPDCPPGCLKNGCGGQTTTGGPLVAIGGLCKNGDTPAKSCVNGASCLELGLNKQAFCYKDKTGIDRCKTSTDPKDIVEGSTDIPFGGLCKFGSETKPCQPGLVCILNGLSGNGYCLKTCNADGDCGSNVKCEEFQGKKACDATKLPLKAQCSISGGATKACQTGLTCVSTDPPTSGFCERTCNADSDCGIEFCTDVPKDAQKRKICYPEGLRRGALCKGTTSTVTACDLGLACVVNGIEDRGYCYTPCSQNSDCGSNEKCLDQGAGKSKICGLVKGADQTCDATVQEFCDTTQNLSCIVSDIERTAGFCRKRCANLFDCQSPTVCTPLNTTSSFCLPKVDPGPRCNFEVCSAQATETNCLSGLVCDEGTCKRKCTRDNADTVCDKAGGESCAIAFGATEGLCLPPASVTEVGKVCNTSNMRCDQTKSLRCVSFTETTSFCVKQCDENKGKDNNPECSAGDKCEKPSSTFAFAFCRKIAKAGERCDTGPSCGEGLICVNFGDPGAFCLSRCQTCKSDAEGNNKDQCSGGACVQLSGSTIINGVSYDGACLPNRPKTLGGGQDCGSDPINGASCKDGYVCLNTGVRATCYRKCDPCTSKPANGDWDNDICTDGASKRCVVLSNANGLTGDGACIDQGGQKVLDYGDRCDQAGKACKDGMICILFSSDSTAGPLCSPNCDPGAIENPQCKGASCLTLTNGGGVCRVVPPQTKKLGENCLGSTGAPDFDDCLAQQDSKPIICARAPFIGQKRTCQVECQLLPGVDGKTIKDNVDCKKYGLNKHLCLPASASEPSRGACLEICQVTDRLRCKTSSCAYGQCREISIGNVGDCVGSAKEQECTTRGGVCIDKTCIVTACN
ncbi:hypothetical protein L6R29_23780 [Myxococcota bacterium]|nr:hypothetical protein [Myxococcota bacterium]